MKRFLTTRTYVKTEVDQSQEEDSATTLIPTPEQFEDSDWSERIEKAKRAREFGQKLRKGKPATFFRIPGFRE